MGSVASISVRLISFKPIRGDNLLTKGSNEGLDNDLVQRLPENFLFGNVRVILTIATHLLSALLQYNRSESLWNDEGGDPAKTTSSGSTWTKGTSSQRTPRLQRSC